MKTNQQIIDLPFHPDRKQISHIAKKIKRTYQYEVSLFQIKHAETSTEIVGLKGCFVLEKKDAHVKLADIFKVAIQSFNESMDKLQNSKLILIPFESKSHSVHKDAGWLSPLRQMYLFR